MAEIVAPEHRALTQLLTIDKATVPFLLLLLFIFMNSQTVYPMAAVASLFFLAICSLGYLRPLQLRTPIFFLVCVNVLYWIVNIVVHGDYFLFFSVDFYRRDGKGFYIFFMLLVFLLFSWQSRVLSAKLTFFARGLLLLGNFVAILSLLDYFHLIPALSQIDQGIGSGVSAKGEVLSSGLYNNHNALAAYLGSIMLIATLFYRETSKSTWLLASLPLLGAFAVASSRAFTGAFGLVLLLVAFTGRGKLPAWVVSRQKLKIAIGIAFLLAAVITLQFTLGVNRFRLPSSMLEEHNVSYRIFLWLKALSYIGLSPVLGLGIGSFNDIFSSVTTIIPHVFAIPANKIPVFGDQHAHNFMLHLLAESGLIGLLLFLALLWVIYKRSRKLMTMPDSNAVLIGRITLLLLIYQVVASMVANSIFAPSSSMIFWLFSAFSFMKFDYPLQQVQFSASQSRDSKQKLVKS